MNKVKFIILILFSVLLITANAQATRRARIVVKNPDKFISISQMLGKKQVACYIDKKGRLTPGVMKQRLRRTVWLNLKKRLRRLKRDRNLIINGRRKYRRLKRKIKLFKRACQDARSRDTYTLSISAINGSITVTPNKAEYIKGEVVELVPKPHTGYYFAGWAGDAQGNRLILNLTMDSDKSIIANFDTWQPPTGIPMPEFGIKETYRMYDDPANRNPDLTYTQNAEGGYYTHYIDNTHPQATDNNNFYGTASTPRETIPRENLPAGSVVEIHGGPYTYGNLSGGYHQVYVSGTGTNQMPVFIRGAAEETPVHTKMYFFIEGFYIVFENVDLNDSRVQVRKDTMSHHISVRNLEIHDGPPVYASCIHVYPKQGSHSHIVIYNNYIHDNGDPDWFDENDFMGVTVTRNAEYVWIIDNHIHGNGGDSVQIASGSAPIEEVARYVYIGRNIMHEDAENAVDLKSCADVIVSENIMYGYDPTEFLHSGSPGTAMVVNDEWPQENIWIIYNEIYNSTTCIRAQHGGKCYIIGNILHDTLSSEKYSSSAISSYSGQDRIMVVGNTVYNVDRGISMTWGGENFVTDIENNIVADVNDAFNHITLTVSEVAQISTMHHNLLFQSSGSGRISWGLGSENLFESLTEFQQRTGKGEGCIGADPFFIDAENNDFRLQSPSLAIDSGVLSDVYQIFFDLYGLDISWDKDGVSRPQGVQWDIGAYEYQF